LLLMAVLVVLLVSWVVFRGIGLLGVSGFGELAGVSALRAGRDVCHDRRVLTSLP
jgi:hypothetical protein